MKKVIGILCVLTLLISACSKSDEESVTLTKEVYDQLMASQTVIEQLQNEVDQLKTKLEGYENEEDSGETTSNEEGVNSQEATTDSAEVGLSPEDISKLTLTPYVGDYELTGYKDQDGRVVIPADYDSGSPFENGTATVTSGGKIGTLNSSGQLTWIKTDTYKPYRLNPVNDVVSDSDFGVFLKEFRAALDSKDQAYIQAHTHPSVKISFGGDSGWSGLVSYWKLDTKDSDFYTVMKNTIKYGLVDQSGKGTDFSGPYVFTNFPETYDAFTHLVCIGEDVNVRKRPTTKAEVVGQLDYDIVKLVEYQAKDGWYKIQMANGDRGYVAESLLRSPIDYRVHFVKLDGEWVFDFFVAGD